MLLEYSELWILLLVTKEHFKNMFQFVLEEKQAGSKQSWSRGKWRDENLSHPWHHQQIRTCHYQCLTPQAHTGTPGTILKSTSFQEMLEKDVRRVSSWGVHFTRNTKTLIAARPVQGKIGLSRQPTLKLDFSNITLIITQKKNSNQGS